MIKDILFFCLGSSQYPDRKWKNEYLDSTIHEYKIIYYDKKSNLYTLSFFRGAFGDQSDLRGGLNLVYLAKEEAEKEFKRCGWKSLPIISSMLILFLIYKHRLIKMILR